MRYFELAAMIARMSSEEQRQHVAIVDLDLGELWWTRNTLSTVIQCGLNPIHTEGVKDTQIVIKIK
jgi:hypothetical protein